MAAFIRPFGFWAEQFSSLREKRLRVLERDYREIVKEFDELIQWFSQHPPASWTGTSHYDNVIQYYRDVVGQHWQNVNEAVRRWQAGEITRPLAAGTIRGQIVLINHYIEYCTLRKSQQLKSQTRKPGFLGRFLNRFLRLCR
jgi:hypothetical protein